MSFERTRLFNSLYSHSRGFSNEITSLKGRKSIGYYVPSKDKKHKRIMTEYDEQPIRILNKKESGIDKGAFGNKANFKNDYVANNRVVQSTKHNQSKNDYLRSVYGSIGSKNIPRPNQASSSQITNHNKSVINDSKDRKKSVYLMTPKPGRQFSQLRRKSLSQCKSNAAKQSKQKLKVNNNKLDNLKIDNIQIDRKTFKQESTVKISKKQTVNQVQNLFNLTDEQFQLFGDRFPYGYQKVKLLGRGGFSLVWLGQHKKSGKLFAIKQIKTQNNHQTHMKQIWFGSLFFTLGGLPRSEFHKHKGIKNISKMYSYEINQLDTWIFYQKCGSSLGSCLYDIKSQRLRNEKMYKIHPKPLYKLMAKNPNILKKLIIQICKALQLLSQSEVVHSDLKTQNILIKYDEQELLEVKLIDYGSSFTFHQIHQFSMATPEYMPYEILNYILCQNESPYDQQLLEKVKQYKNSWVIDIWSLGCVVLQIINGIPLWMSLPLLIQTSSSNSIKSYGLFAVKGRGFQQIIQKQCSVISNLEKILLQYNYSDIRIDKSLLTVLRGMLQFQPNKRICPEEVIRILTQSMNE